MDWFLSSKPSMEAKQGILDSLRLRLIALTYLVLMRHLLEHERSIASTNGSNCDDLCRNCDAKLRVSLMVLAKWQL